MALREKTRARRAAALLAAFTAAACFSGFPAPGAAQSVPYACIYNEVQAYGIRGGVKWSPRPDGRLLFHHAELAR